MVSPLKIESDLMRDIGSKDLDPQAFFPHGEATPGHCLIGDIDRSVLKNAEDAPGSSRLALKAVCALPSGQPGVYPFFFHPGKSGFLRTLKVSSGFRYQRTHIIGNDPFRSLGPK